MNKTKRCLLAVGLSSTALCLCFLTCKKKEGSLIHSYKTFLCQFVYISCFFCCFFVVVVCFFVFLFFFYLFFFNLDTIVLSYYIHILAALLGNLSSWSLSRSNIKLSVQSQKMVFG